MLLFMSTTVHIPAGLLSRVDALARVRGVSRNRLVVEALEHELDARDSWPPELADMLSRPLGREAASLLDESLREMRARRTNRRRAPDLER